MTTVSNKLMTADELLAMPRGIKRYELIRGALIEYPLTENLGGQAASRISVAISNWMDNRECGHAVIGCGFWLEKNPDTVRSCHIAWIATDSVVEGYPKCAPELAIEIKSPSNSWPEITAKAYMWLCYGSQQVWVADPPTATITVYNSLNTAPVTLSEDDVLDGGDLLPGFFTPVWRLFRRRR